MRKDFSRVSSSRFSTRQEVKSNRLVSWRMAIVVVGASGRRNLAFDACKA